MKPQDIVSGAVKSLWIFGYGSLVWKPDFKYRRSKVGYIRGFKRRFWHGDNFHRGNDELPGRVVTLLEDDDACTWGMAFEVTGPQVDECLRYLNVREGVRGGYVTRSVEFTPEGGEEEEEEEEEEKENQVPGSLQALVYIATPDNPLYLGPASPEVIGAQIAVSQGKTGHNLEYLLRLAAWMRASCPHVEDHHLYAIERAALAIVPYLLGAQ